MADKIISMGWRWVGKEMRPEHLYQVELKSVMSLLFAVVQFSFILHSISPYLQLPTSSFVWCVHEVKWFTKRVVWFALSMLIQCIWAIQYIWYSEIP